MQFNIEKHKWFLNKIYQDAAITMFEATSEHFLAYEKDDLYKLLVSGFVRVYDNDDGETWIVLTDKGHIYVMENV